MLSLSTATAFRYVPSKGTCRLTRGDLADHQGIQVTSPGTAQQCCVQVNYRVDCCCRHLIVEPYFSRSLTATLSWQRKACSHSSSHP
jgi:hypothetical protein